MGYYISYSWIVFSALRRVRRLKLFAAREFRFQLQNEKKPVVKSSGTGPGLGWISPLSVSKRDKIQKAERSTNTLEVETKWRRRIYVASFMQHKRNLKHW